MSTIDIDALLVEISPQAPCGPNLEYDPVFQALEREALGKAEVQYGSTITPAVPPDWKTVRRMAAELIDRSRDLRLAVYLTRANLALNGIAGLADGLTLIERLLDGRGPASILRSTDDDNDPSQRINSLAILSETTTLVRELKDASLVPCPAWDLSRPECSRSQAANCHPHRTGKDRTRIDRERHRRSRSKPARRRRRCARQGAERGRQHRTDPGTPGRQRPGAQFRCLGPTAAQGPCLPCFLEAGRSRRPGRPCRPRRTPGPPSDSPARAPRCSAGGDIASRDDVLRMLDHLLRYYQRNEPSSPVPILLERAKRLVPMNFFEIMKDLAPDGVAQLVVIRGPEGRSGKTSREIEPARPGKHVVR
jgi:type VI secretion system protein ImpA